MSIFNHYLFYPSIRIAGIRWKIIPMLGKDYPNAWKNYSREISLPVYYDLTDEQVQFIAQVIIEVVNQAKGS